MTVPATTVAPAAPEPAAPVRVPIHWLLDHGSWPVRARALLELAPPTAEARGVIPAVYAHEPALRLAVQQRRDGLWGNRMLAVPPADDPNFTGVGTIPAIRRLLEYGWEHDAPPFACAKRILFRLLAEDMEPEFLFELRGDTRDDEYLVRRGRLILREAAAATLAQLGFEADPRLRGAAVRLLERVSAYVRSTLTAQQSDGEGEKPAPDPKEPLPPTAAPPSAHLLVMLAYMPRFRSEHQDEIAKLGAYLAAAPAGGTIRQIIGKQTVEQSQLIVGDPLVGAVAGTGKASSLTATLAWLELFARIGFLKQNAAWSGLLDSLLAERDNDGLWRGRAASMGPSTKAWDWPTYPLGDPSVRENRVADLTFRLALIAKLAGRPLELG